MADILNSYISGRTNFISHQVDIIPEDIPVVSFCYGSNVIEKQDLYGIDINISVRVGHWLKKYRREKVSSNLSLDTSTRIGQFSVKIERMWTDNNIDPDFQLVYNCYKTSITNGISSDKYNSSWMFRIQADFSHKAPSETSVYFTSESNSYGVVMERWYDGKVGTLSVNAPKGYARYDVSHCHSHDSKLSLN